MAKKPKQYHSCMMMRRMKITHSTLHASTGEIEQGKTEWVTRRCGVPLFGEEERAIGKCRSCARGWTHPENYPVGEGASA